MVKLDLKEISSELVRSVLCKTIQDELKSQHFNIELTPASNDGETNYVGILLRVSFWKDETADTGIRNRSARKLILKIAPEDLARRTRYIARPGFLREIYMYENVLHNFRKFELSKGMTEENGFNEYPKLYNTVDTDCHECLLLEDLSVRGFIMLDKNKEEVTADHVNLVLRGIAKFHAISFALKDQQPKQFEEIIPHLEEIVFREGTIVAENKKLRTEQLYCVLSDETDAHLLAKLQEVFSNPSNDADCIDPIAAEPATIVTHGDAWQNNVMFRYNNDGKPIEASLLDWQISRYSSPVLDIVHFIFSCTTKELRDAHYDDFLKNYHETLSTHIQRLGSDPKKLFPYELMIEHLRKFGKYGLIMATMVLTVITADSGTRRNLNERSKLNVKRSSVEFSSQIARHNYEKRLRDVIIDMVRLDYI